METLQLFYDFEVDDIDGNPISLSAFKGKVLLVVNVASQCTYTPQYAGLEALYQKYKNRGFEVLAFPSNNFFWQEPGSNEQIKKFCQETYGVTFPLFSKIHVRGRYMSPLYRWLIAQPTQPVPPGAITWNFNKFLINRKGQAVYRFPSKTEPLSEELIQAVEILLNESEKNIAIYRKKCV